MSKWIAPLAALALAALALTGAAAGGTHKAKMSFVATLNAGQEVPHPKGAKAGAAGKFTVTVVGATLRWKLTYSHLSGPGIAAHIHAGRKGKAGAVIVPLCGPCRSGQTGTATVTSDVLDQLEAGTAYVNVHTNANQGGEIRGQIRMTM